MNSDQFLDWLDQKNQLSQFDDLQKPLLMGVLNVTKESFSDGGKFITSNKASEHAFNMIEQGADIIDIGGESSRPGATPLSVESELTRVIPVIESIRAHSNVCISIDTYKPEVMRAAVAAGANLINDIYALQSIGALEAAAELAVPVCLMHIQGTPQNMQSNPQYPNGLISELSDFFAGRIKECVLAGIKKSRLILDPGFGFGKLVPHNLQIIKRLASLKEFKIPLLLGVSRKSTIGAVLNKEIDQRLIGGVALAVYAALQGVGIIRTHDVDATNQALQMIDAVHSEVG